MTNDPRKGARILLDTIHKVSTALLIALMLMAVDTLNETSRQILTLTVSVDYFKQEIEKFQSKQYTENDSQRDLMARDFRIKTLETRVLKLEESRYFNRDERP